MWKVQFVIGLPWALETSLRAQKGFSVSAVGRLSVELGPFAFLDGKEYRVLRMKTVTFILHSCWFKRKKKDDTKLKTKTKQKTTGL